MDEQGRRSFGTNWGPRLLLSLLLAIVIWGWVTATGDPERTKAFPNVPLTVSGLDDALVIVGEVGAVEVHVSGPKSTVDDLVSTDMEATIDLGKVTQPGTYSIKIHVPKPENAWSTSANPQAISVSVEAQATANFPIETRISGDLGANQQVESVSPATAEVSVTGPSSLVGTVDRVELPIDIANRTTDFASVFTPVAVNAGGQAVAGVTLNPATISATVQVTARGKRVAVIAQLQGDPAPGFEVVDRLVNPNTVLVDGPADVLDSMITVNTDMVDISGAQDDVTVRVKVVGLPANVKILEPQAGQVDVVVQIRQRGVQQPLPSQQVQIVDLGPDLAASVTPNSVQVTVIGNEQELENLSPSSLVVQVSADGLGPGTYQLPLTVILPANMEWTAVDPPTVTLTVEQKPNGSPTPEAIRTPSPGA